jgi:hypothetical protein
MCKNKYRLLSLASTKKVLSVQRSSISKYIHVRNDKNKDQCVQKMGPQIKNLRLKI